ASTEPNARRSGRARRTSALRIPLARSRRRSIPSSECSPARPVQRMLPMTPPAPATSTRTKGPLRLPRARDRQQQVRDIARRLGMPELRVEDLAPERCERSEYRRRSRAATVAEIPRPTQAEREVANLRARVPVLCDDPIDLTSSGERTFDGAHERAGALSV